MEERKDLPITTFKIVLNNKILQIDYDPSFKEYYNKTIASVIEEVLKKIGPKPSEKTYKDYELVCSCGRSYNPDKLICQAKCFHYSESDYNQEKNKNEKFFLYEKEEEEEKYEKYLSHSEISSILMKSTGAKNQYNLKGIIPYESNNNFQISENLRKKINELYIKEKRGYTITDNGYELKYDENLYNNLLEFEIPNDRIKAALRICRNKKEEALLIATDESYNWNDKDYLYYENNQVLSPVEFRSLCTEEVKKEFPLIKDEEEINIRVKQVINRVTNSNQANNRDSEESDIMEEEIDSLSDNPNDSFSSIFVNRFII